MPFQVVPRKKSNHNHTPGGGRGVFHILSGSSEALHCMCLHSGDNPDFSK